MRVSLITETYFPQVNGVSRTLGELVRHLGAAGDAVQLLHPDYGQPPVHATTHVVRSVRLPFYKEILLPLPTFGAVGRALDAFRPQIIHIATEATLGLTVLRYARARKIPVVSSFHTNFDQYSGYYHVGWARRTIWRYLRWFHNQTRQTYVPSRTAIRTLEEQGFERLVLWPRGVDSTLFRPDRPGRAAVRQQLGWRPEDVVITYVSRLAHEKNVAYLARALADVAAKRPNVRLLLVGDGPARGEVEQTLRGMAHFAGYRTGPELADYYAAGDLFAFTSLTETFGNVVLEAFASGMPVVALRAGGVGDTVQHETTGLLVEPSDPPERLSQALISLVDDAGRRHAMSLAARSYALSQSWDAIMGTLAERYEHILAEASSTVPALS